MRLEKIELTDYRNIAKASLEFKGNRIFFIGENGQGKTNLLEAIALAQGGGSFRTHQRFPMVANGAAQAIVRQRWLHESRGATVLAAAIDPKHLSLTLDKEPLKNATKIMGTFPVVSLSLADRELIYGGPEARRAEIDGIVRQIDPTYAPTLEGYEKALRSRNALLGDEKATDKQFDAFESVMEPLARRIIKSRERAVELLGPLMETTLGEFAPADEKAALAYAPNCGADELRENWAALRHTKDAILGYTTKGPQRDNFELTLHGQAVELYASEGQKFSVVLSLKMAGLHLLEEKLKTAPVLVCDDLLLELDRTRQERFWRAIGEHQVFASGTCPPASTEGWEIYRVKAGVFSLEA